MSYNIAVVIPPIPEGDFEAWKAIDALIDEEGEAPPIFRQLHDQLTARYPCLCSLSDEEIGHGVWSDGPLWGNFGSRAAVLGISYSRVGEVLPFLVATATSLELSVFDWGTEQIHRGDGLRGLSLTVESKPILRSPTLLQILAAVDALTPDGGPGFLILERDSQDYAQTAGGCEAYTLEWREHSRHQFRHWVAGLPNRPSRNEVAIPTNGFQVSVKENEQLSGEDVKVILSAFARKQGRPLSYVWRDVTARFQ